MKQFEFLTRLGTFVASLYIAVGFGVFLTAADNYMGKQRMMPLPPTVAAICFLSSIVLFVAVRDFLSKKASIRLSFLLRSNLPVILPFGSIAFLSLLFALNPGAYWGDEKKWIFLQSYDFSVFMTAMLVPLVHFVRKHFHTFVTIGLLTILGSIWYDVNYPGTFSTVPNRAAGFPTNSNWSAVATVMLCSMSLRYKDGWARVSDALVFALTGIGLYFTLSRSGVINFVFLLAFYIGITLYTSKGKLKTSLTIVGGATALIFFFLMMIPLLASNSAVFEGSKSQNRLLALASGEVVDEGSAADRLEAARDTLNKINASPLIGNGTGFNRRLRQTPHNLYLKLWVDAGMFGLLTWIGLLASAFWMFTSRSYRPGQGLVIVVAFGSFFSHNILEERTFLLLFGMASAMSVFDSALMEQQRLRIEAVLRKLRAAQNLEPRPPKPEDRVVGLSA